LYGVTE